MSLNQDNSRDYSPVGFNKNVPLIELDRFVKNLEKHFFSTVTVRSFSPTPSEVNLVIELDCNFELVEILDHFKKEIWGNFVSKKHSLIGELEQLRDSNQITIEIEEFSIFMKDTSIIINKIYNQSIPEQLEKILNKISTHYIHFTKGLSEIPYEIYVPVFEDDVIENDHNPFIDLESTNTFGHDYFSFWGLYFYSEEDAVYDLKNQSTITDSIEILNR